MALFWRRPVETGATVVSPPEHAAPAQELVDGIPDPAALLDPRGQIAAANRGIGALFSRDQCEGRTLLELSRSAELSEAVTRSLRGDRVRAQIRLPSSDIVVQVSVSPISGGAALLVLRDLTEDKRLESVRRDFIANASHELRTPVSAISGAVETLLGGAVKLEPEARGFVEMIARHADR